MTVSAGTLARFAQIGKGENVLGTTLDGLVWVPSGMVTIGNRPPEFFPWTQSFGTGINSFITLNKADHTGDASLVFTVGGAPIWEVGATTSKAGGPSDYNVKRVFGPADGGIFQDVLSVDYATGSLLIRRKGDQQTLLNPQYIQPIVDGLMFDWVVGAGWSTAESLPAPLPARLPPSIYGSAKAITATSPTTEVVSLAKLIVDEISRNAKASINVYSTDATGGSIAVELRWLDAAGNVISTVLGNGIPSGMTGWQESVALGAAPPLAVRMQLAVRPFAATGVWYVTVADLLLTVVPGTSFGIGIGTDVPLAPIHVANTLPAGRTTAVIENFSPGRALDGTALPWAEAGSQSSVTVYKGVGTAWEIGNDIAMNAGVGGGEMITPRIADNWFCKWGLLPDSPHIDPADNPYDNPDFSPTKIYANRSGVTVNGTNNEPNEALRVESMGVAGFLPPSVTTEQRLSFGPKNPGLMVWDKELKRAMEWDGAEWQQGAWLSDIDSGASPVADLLAYGDSLTAGVGGTSWTSQYQTQSGFVAGNEGVGGETAMQVRDRLAVDVRRTARPVVIWAGRNDLTNPATQAQADGIKARIAEMINGLGHTAYLVLGVTNQDVAGERLGEADYAIIDQLNADLDTAYGVRFADVRRELIDNGLTLAGITPTAQDLIDIAADVIPSSLRSDALHLNTAGYGVVASLVDAELTALSIAGGLAIGGGGGVSLDAENTWTARQTFAGGIALSGAGSFDPGAAYVDASLGVVLGGVAGSVYNWGVYTPAGLGVLQNPTGTRNLVAAGRMRIEGDLTEINTGSGWLLARNVVTGGNGLDSVNAAQTAFAPLNIQTTAGGLSVNGNVVADVSTALMLTGAQTAAGRKTFASGIAVGFAGGFAPGGYYGDGVLGLVIGGLTGSTNAITITDAGGITAMTMTAARNWTVHGDLKIGVAGGKLGYTSGGASVTQLTSKATAVTINSTSGTIVTHTSSLAAGAEVAFTVNNSAVSASDIIVLHRISGGSNTAYHVEVAAVAAGSFSVLLTNLSTGALSQALTLRFMVLSTT